eukprot:TRINITY_DN44005_c0_g1_i1.p1 TRINITY_DN44005_c0_g1~~TRINITY_DN44005_c0_g1_i1.p1  ORF type:complete len:340 (-),score=32.02 TRINITY_DN44005_c0_g1_i1:157-1176(-)
MWWHGCGMRAGFVVAGLLIASALDALAESDVPISDSPQITSIFRTQFSEHPIAASRFMQRDIVVSQGSSNNKLSPWECVHGSVFLTLGIVIGAFGYRLYRINIFLTGSAAATSAVYLIMVAHHTEADHPWALHLIATLCGITCGLCVFQFYPIGVFVMGASWGATMTLMTNGLLISRIANAIPVFGKEESNLPLYFSLVVASLAFGVVSAGSQYSAKEATWKQRLLVFVQTSVPGAYLISQGVRTLAQLTEIPSEGNMAQHSSLPDEYYMLAGGSVLTVVLLVMVQLMITQHENWWQENNAADTHNLLMFYYHGDPTNKRATKTTTSLRQSLRSSQLAL